MTDLDVQLEPPFSGCLGATLALLCVMGFLLVSCVIIADRMFPDAPIETISRTEFPSPEGDYVAVLYQREQSIMLGRAYWTDLAVSRRSESESLVGSIGRRRPDVQWTNEHRLLVTLHARPLLDIQTSIPGVKIVFHLDDSLHVESYVGELQRQENDYAKSDSDSREACRTIYRNWGAARDFYSWARLNADNGDPDPGPWISKAFPTDCSALPKP